MPYSPPVHKPPGKSRAQRERERKAAYDKTRPSATQRGYDSKWRRESKQWLLIDPAKEDKPKNRKPCAHCGVSSELVDHIVPHKGDMKLFWRRSNWQPLCTTCHSRKTAMEDSRFGRRHRTRPRGIGPMPMPVTMVCGPPAGGKTTWVRSRLGACDRVIDLGDFFPLTPDGTRLPRNEDTLANALRARNEALYELAKATDIDRLWFVMQGPRVYDRTWWRDALGAQEVIVFETPLDVCLRRTQSDPARRLLIAEHETMSIKWWQTYEPQKGEKILTE